VILDGCNAVLLVRIHKSDLAPHNIPLEFCQHLASGRLVGAERHATALAFWVGELAVPLRRFFLDLAGIGGALRDAMPLLIDVTHHLDFQQTAHGNASAKDQSFVFSWSVLVAPRVAPTFFLDCHLLSIFGPEAGFHQGSQSLCKSFRIGKLGIVCLSLSRFGIALGKHTHARFPSWTSGVRIPSPALDINPAETST
jgi:hypothetical protein